MPRIQIDGFAGIPTDRPVLPPDRYTARVESMEMKKASTGKDMVETRFTIQEEPYEGVVLYHNFVLFLEKDKNWRIREFVEVAGADFDEDGFDTEAVIGCVCVAEVTVKQHEGQDRNEIKKFLPLES